MHAQWTTNTSSITYRLTSFPDQDRVGSICSAPHPAWRKVISREQPVPTDAWPQPSAFTMLQPPPTAAAAATAFSKTVTGLT